MTFDEVKIFVADTFGVAPDYPFGDDDTAVFRHEVSKKWFGIVMNIPRSRLGLASEEPAFVMNLKCDPLMMGSVRDGVTVFPAYHMNKEHWISVLLDENADEDKVKWLVGLSFDLTYKTPKKKK